ncbi:hypothetical protein ACQPYK_00800 [Streptosporangium sp. CA-135522]|uniref:hypothetical protein n=1 Tax=Streptosporangium sp. CA-135522 TaxID=3240072 RepID=UPI003D8ACE31
MLRNLAYGVGLVVALAATTAAQTLPWKEKYDDQSGEGGPAVTAGLDRPARLYDMEWRLKDITSGKPGASPTRPLPPRTRVVVVVFSVKPLTPAASRWFTDEPSGDCSVQVADRSGRIWSPSFRTGVAPGPNKDGCKSAGGDLKPEPLAVGRERTVQKAFIVPQDAIAGLQVEVRMPRRPGVVRMAR